MRPTLLFIGIATLTGCFGADGDGGQFGEESGMGCEIVNTTVLTLDEQSSLGFSGQSVLDYAGISDDDVLEYESGTTTPIHIAVTYDEGAVRYVEEQMVSDGGDGGIEPAIAMDCPWYVEVEVTIAISTDDGAFDESWVTSIRSSADGEASWNAKLEDLTGSFDPWAYVDSAGDYDEVTARFEVTWDSLGSHGELVGQATGTVGDPDDPDSIAFAEFKPMGTWGDDGEPDI